VIPLVRWLSASVVVCLRPVVAQRSKPSLSIIVPARNERGNIRNVLERMPDFGGAKLEVVFVEGHSSDGTWEEIQRVIEEPGWPMACKAYQQTGVGKADAVRLGFENASSDLLTILDADLTMPPELLPSYYECYRQGHGDFINGSRLVYPMEGGAMRFLNQLANIFFAKAITVVTEARISDALCGTKLVARHDYQRFKRWREDFGDFDPFGDFELIFPASVIGLGIVDVPVRYRMRTYGETQIRRFRDGWQLLKMVAIGFLRIKLGRA
jgi:glycosyltransferase involved in cell wall biosynthesis